MKLLAFSERQFLEIRKGGLRVLKHKIELAIPIGLKMPLYVVAIPFVLMLRIIRPVFLVRVGELNCSRIGHFAANTEMYLCAQAAGIDKPKQRSIDLIYLSSGPICNMQLLKMWRRKLQILPRLLLQPLGMINQIIPGGNVHRINSLNSALDTNNLLDKYPAHLNFTHDENVLGESLLRDMGIPFGEKFICLNVRDNVYLASHLAGQDFSYHDYRDSDIQNYVLAAETLANRGYFVVRMGAKVKASIRTKNVRIIDYATNGMRNDFMDIYLGVKCHFAISTGSGWDAIPEISRRPIVYVNFAPLGYMHTSREEFITIIKKYHSVNDGYMLTLSQIASGNKAYYLHAADYESDGIKLIENTPEEICDVAIEMLERLSGTWIAQKDDEVLQKKFWNMFPDQELDNGMPMHGKILGRYGAAFLRNNPGWLR